MYYQSVQLQEIIWCLLLTICKVVEISFIHFRKYLTKCLLDSFLRFYVRKKENNKHLSFCFAKPFFNISHFTNFFAQICWSLQPGCEHFFAAAETHDFNYVMSKLILKFLLEKSRGLWSEKFVYQRCMISLARKQKMNWKKNIFVSS